MKRFAAYTIIEITVALTISSIVIVLAMNLYLQLNRTNQNVLKEYDHNLEMLNLMDVIKNDVDRFNKIEYSIYEFRFTNKEALCLYEFTDQEILRRFQNNIDTFRLEFLKLEYKKQYGNTGYVTDFSFKIKVKEQVYPFCFHKNYSSDHKVNDVIF